MSPRLEKLPHLFGAIGPIGFMFGGPVVLGLSASHLSLSESGSPWWAWFMLAAGAVLYFLFLGFFTEDRWSSKDAVGFGFVIAGFLLVVFALVAGVYSAYVLSSEGASSPWWAWGGYLVLCVASSSMIFVCAGSNVVERTMALVIFVLLMVPLWFLLGRFDVDRQVISLLMLGPIGATVLLIAIAGVSSSKPI